MGIAVASAPGKILWLGSYAVLQKPNVSYATAVNARVWARCETLLEKKIVLEAPPVEAKAWGHWTGFVLQMEASEDEEKRLRFLKAAAEAALRFLAFKETPLRGLRVETFNDAAFGKGDQKTGLGSSAACVVAVVASILETHGFPLEKNRETVHKLAQLANYRAQNKAGSGFDVASACYGSVVYSRYSPETLEGEFEHMVEKDWDFRLERMALPKGMRIAVGFTGKSANTREFVKKIEAFDRKSHQDYALWMEEANAENEKAVLLLKKMSDLSRKEPEKYARLAQFFEGNGTSAEVSMLEEELTAFREFRHAFENGRRLVKKLGEMAHADIEGAQATALIEESGKHGAFACKLPGAGGGDSVAALCLGKESHARLRAFWREQNVELLDVQASDEGVRKETGEAWDKLQATDG